MITDQKFGQYLVSEGLLVSEDLKVVVERRKTSSRKLGELCVELGFLSAQTMGEALGRFLGIPYFSLQGAELRPPKNLPLQLKFMRQHRVLPLELHEDRAVVLMADPLNYGTREALEMALGVPIEIQLGDETSILEAVETHFGSGTSSMTQIIRDMSQEELEILSGEEDEDVDQLRDMASEAPVIRLVNLIISRAVESRASDIHIEPFEGELRIRFRVDGVLHDQESPPRALQPAIISRVKIMAKLNIAERRLPQDGRIPLRITGRKIDLRVSCIPTLYGESVVLRILDRSSYFRSLADLGFAADAFAIFERLIHQPHGILLITGPTGSGKTTTLYAALEKINSPDKKIITVEDPVEYQLRGVNQIQANPKIGLTFGSGLRSIVRQDPDVIMIGEIRDLETAEIAIQSALTGHLVFSTVHTNDAPTTVTRLLDMGVESYLVSSCLLGIMAQRLVRTICTGCRKPVKADPAALRQMELDPDLVGEVTVYVGAGCRECGQTGYRGRAGIFEILPIDDTFRQAIQEKVSASRLRQMARQAGMRTLRADGWRQILAGTTTIEEVVRVTQDEEVLVGGEH